MYKACVWCNERATICLITCVRSYTYTLRSTRKKAFLLPPLHVRSIEPSSPAFRTYVVRAQSRRPGRTNTDRY